MTKYITQAQDVIWHRIGDDIVVIKDNGLTTHILNKTAAFIWEMCNGKCGIDEITKRLYEYFEVSRDEARADASDTINIFNKKGIIKYTSVPVG